jgi:hypothetical protein
MVSKAARAVSKSDPKSDLPVVEELQFRSDNAFLCLLLNRRTKFIRVIDFRAGALPAKRLFIQSIAQREGAEKVILLVEKDEVSSWTRVGFVREGTVPGFYKRSDGHLVGCVIGDRTASEEVSEDTQRLAERTINAAKKVAVDAEGPVSGVTVKSISKSAAETARDAAWSKNDGTLGCFDAFGRGAEPAFIEATHKKGQKPNHLMAEFQDCFGHSLIEILRMPKNQIDVDTITGGLRHFCEVLKAREIVSAFSFAPVDSVELSIAFLSAGFRKTGLLAKGVRLGEERKDAILWTRKLADPSGGDPAEEEAEG